VQSAWNRAKKLVGGKAYWDDSADAPGFKETKVLRQVFNRAAEKNPTSVLAVMDDFCWKSNWMMAIGDVKGKILEAEVKNRQPKVAVEFGGYCGYSAVLIAKDLPHDGHLYSFELDPLHAAIATKIVEFAGLAKKVTVIVGTANEKLHLLKSQYNISAIDLLFIDHVKHLYLPDFKLVEQLSLLPKGAVVVADNILFPGAPDYLAYVTNNPHYKTTQHMTVLEYQHEKKDIVTVSIRL